MSHIRSVSFSDHRVNVSSCWEIIRESALGFVCISFALTTVAAARSDVQQSSLLGDCFPGTCRSFSELHMNMCRERLEGDDDLWSAGKLQL